jgi:CheY-like chemotaxis protein
MEEIKVPQPLRVLAVDDNVDTADSLALLLTIWGHEARVAYDGPTALATALAYRPEVVLLDIGLPRMDGYQVARQLRRQTMFENALLVAITGYAQEKDFCRSGEAGFDLHLVKPLEPESLRELLAAFQEFMRHPGRPRRPADDPPRRPTPEAGHEDNRGTHLHPIA